MNFGDGIVDSSDNFITSGSVLYIDASQFRSFSGSASTTWNDLTSNANTLVLYNGAAYTSSVGGNIRFDGTNDGVSGSNAAVYTITNNITIEVWMFSTASSGFVVGKGPSNGVANNFPGNYELQIAANNALAFLHQTSTTAGNSNFQSFTSATNVFSLNTWNHIVVTCNGTTGTLYVNGVSNSLTRAGTVGSIISTNTQTLKIGRRTDGAVMAGNIALVRLYNRILSAAEVLTNFNLTKSRFGYGQIVTSGSVITLDASNRDSYSESGTTWTDISGNGFNATMSGSVIYSGSLPSSFQYVTGSNNFFLGNNDLTGSVIDGVTIMSWVKVNNTAARSFVFSKYNTSGIPGYLFELGTVSGLWTNTLRFYAQGTVAVSTDYRGVANAITQGNICSVAATYNFSTKVTAMYVNGRAISATQAGGTQANVSSDWYKSTPLYRIGSTRPFGNLDAAMNQYNIRVYNRALTATEIFINFDAERSQFGV